MLGIGQVDVGDVVHDGAVNHFGHVPVPASVAGFHVEDGDLEALGADGGQGGVGITQDQEGIWGFSAQDVVRFGDDVAHGLAQVFAHAVQVVIGDSQAQVFKEDLVEGVVPVLSGVDEDMIKVPVAFFDGGGESDDLGPCA